VSKLPAQLLKASDARNGAASDLIAADELENRGRISTKQVLAALANPVTDFEIVSFDVADQKVSGYKLLLDESIGREVIASQPMDEGTKRGPVLDGGDVTG